MPSIEKHDFGGENCAVFPLLYFFFGWKGWKERKDQRQNNDLRHSDLSHLSKLEA